ncbi:hypothetical protein CVIRNUC_004108 [Coccomyxa viridis]|uniref:ABC transporter domain-containing protein n=1 Tax=Coccomyxa viridis TaxID=1274662 RepID=A0AAV1I0W8_9CHLO|nr:hypothetical protein CVIRNUC_004108 [Coccomyxa viridis]
MCSSKAFQGGIAVQSQPVGRLTDAWIRGCSCRQGGCKHIYRWRPGDAAGKDEENLTSSMPNSVLPVTHPVDLAWSSLACKVLDRQSRLTRQILFPTSGQIVPGEMMALVGPSGAGKSTLLDILAGRKVAKVSGQVWANGTAEGARLKRASAYVAQEELYVPTLSCWETLRFHAVLRNRERASRGALKERMQDVLSVLGLWKVQGTQVGGILAGGLLVRGLSGGEKRRLGIACALIGKPSLLFLDEPTTGLDSFAALNIMEHLSGLAASGHTILASVHQPCAAIWDMLHKVLVLSEGHQLYFGPPEQVTDWFRGCLGYSFRPGQHGSVADWLMDLVSVGFSKPAALGGTTMTSRADVVTASELWHARRQKAKGAEEDGLMIEDSAAGEEVLMKEQSARRESRHAVGWWTQFAWLLRRSLVSQLRNPTDVTSRLLLSAWIGLLAGAGTCCRHRCPVP